MRESARLHSSVVEAQFLLRDKTARDLIDYPEFGQKLGVEEVIARVPELKQIAEIVPVPFKAVSSTALEIDDWLAIRSAIHDAFIDPELSGIVVLHGTDRWRRPRSFCT